MNEQIEEHAPGASEGALIDEVVALLLAMAQQLQHHAATRAAELDLTLSQAKALMEIEPGKPIPMGALAVRLNVDASNLTGLVDRLEARGALERRPDPADRRVKALVLTEEGERLQQAFRDRLLDYRGSFGPLTVAQLAQLRDLLRVALAKA